MIVEFPKHPKRAICIEPNRQNRFWRWHFRHSTGACAGISGPWTSEVMATRTGREIALANGLPLLLRVPGKAVVALSREVS